MSRIDYRYFERLLQREKEKLVELTEQGGTEKHPISFRESIQELSLYDNHPADTGSELFERSKDFALRERRLRELEEIDLALERMASGQYGLCLDCGQRIAEERLKALPSASYCLDCKEKREEGAQGARPVEEDSLYPPFQRTFRDESDYTGYDGEDAWQEVARYGTSSSPQDVPGAVSHPAYLHSSEDIGAVEKMDKLPSSKKNGSKDEEEKNTGSKERD